ncbi:MAG: N-acetylneuraminate synthase family protein [Nitrosopumilus sp.]|nr:N-acetylneuraminate synthase family protein [Nitrosopumilus sp.]
MFLIAEIGSNWDGDITLAKDTIDACKNAGADAVKFQLWKTDIVYPNNPENKKWQMSFDQAKFLYKYAKTMDMLCFFTPSYPEAVDFLENELHVPMYKIASVTSAMKHPYSLEVMHKVADTGKPVIISFGYGDNTDKIFEQSKLIMLECVSKYPANYNDYKSIGYHGVSDHTIGTNLMFDNKHKIIEKHVKLRDNSSPDSPFSLYTDELADFITLSKSL